MNAGISISFFPISAILVPLLHILGFGHSICTAADDATRHVLSVNA